MNVAELIRPPIMHLVTIDQDMAGRYHIYVRVEHDFKKSYSNQRSFKMNCWLIIVYRTQELITWTGVCLRAKNFMKKNLVS